MKTILIIEDDRDTLELLGLIGSNYNVILSSDVLPITEIEEINPALILLDQWINECLGSDLCYRLKQNPKTRDIPIVIVSALQNIGEIAFNSQADGSLTKPFEIEEIEAVFETYLD